MMQSMSGASSGKRRRMIGWFENVTPPTTTVVVVPLSPDEGALPSGVRMPGATDKPAAIALAWSSAMSALNPVSGLHQKS